VAYAIGVALLVRHGTGTRLAAVVAVGIAIQLAPLAAPLLLSTDAWTYWDYGRIAAVHDGNPYRDTPADFPTDPAFPWAGRDWRGSTSVYGPAFTLASEPIARAAGSSEDAAAWIYKAGGALAVLVGSWLATLAAGRRALAFALVSWNPVLAIHFAGGGHNDAWMATLAVAALALAARGRGVWSGAAWAGAVLVKWVPLVLVPVHLVQLRRRELVVKVISGFALATATVALLAGWRYGFAWLDAVTPIARNARTETEYSVPHRLTQLGAPRGLALGTAVAAFVAVYAWLLRDAAHGRPRVALTAGALLLATPYLAPWYLAWIAPLAAAEDDVWARRLTLALTAYLLPQTIPL